MNNLDTAFVGDVVRRLLVKLDEVAEPFRGIDEDGNKVEWRDWMMHHCFSEDHDLYDDVMALLGMTWTPGGHDTKGQRP